MALMNNSYKSLETAYRHTHAKIYFKRYPVKPAVPNLSKILTICSHKTENAINPERPTGGKCWMDGTECHRKHTWDEQGQVKTLFIIA